MSSYTSQKFHLEGISGGQAYEWGRGAVAPLPFLEPPLNATKHGGDGGGTQDRAV